MKQGGSRPWIPSWRRSSREKAMPYRHTHKPTWLSSTILTQANTISTFFGYQEEEDATGCWMPCSRTHHTTAKSFQQLLDLSHAAQSCPVCFFLLIFKSQTVAFHSWRHKPGTITKSCMTVRLTQTQNCSFSGDSFRQTQVSLKVVWIGQVFPLQFWYLYTHAYG